MAAQCGVAARPKSAALVIRAVSTVSGGLESAGYDTKATANGGGKMAELSTVPGRSGFK
jgi:hypothetical protein